MRDDALCPADTRHLVDVLQWAIGHARPLEIRATGTKDGYGYRTCASQEVNVSGLCGVIDYEPAELVVTARPATPVAELEQLLRAENQHLAFEPSDLGPLLGNPPGKATLGGIIAGNLSGPKRVRAGAVRDHLLGFQAVTGRGDVIRSGGRVVKNVTGYDLSKLMCGSWGTLAVATEVSVKVLPAPEKVRTIIVPDLSPQDACRICTEALSAPHDVCSAAYLSRESAARSSSSRVSGIGASVLAIRIEGPPVSVASRLEALKDSLARHGEIDELHRMHSEHLWKDIRDVRILRTNDEPVWKISLPMARGGHVHSELLAHGADGIFDWGGALIWCRAPEQLGETIRQLASNEHGEATLVAANDSVKSRLGVFHPLPSGTASLMQRIKNSFDPAGVLNPGRMGVV